jgi:hypothetical protein
VCLDGRFAGAGFADSDARFAGALRGGADFFAGAARFVFAGARRAAPFFLGVFLGFAAFLLGFTSLSLALSCALVPPLVLLRQCRA